MSHKQSRKEEPKPAGSKHNVSAFSYEALTSLEEEVAEEKEDMLAIEHSEHMDAHQLALQDKLLMELLEDIDVADGAEEFSPFWVRLRQLLIIANVMLIGAECQSDIGVNPYLSSLYFFLDIFFQVMFSLEAAFMLARSGVQYFKSALNVIDFAVVCVVWADYLATATLSDCPYTNAVGGIRIIRVFRCIRIIRVLRVLRTQPKLVLPLEGLFASLSTLVWVFIALAMVLFFFSVLFVSVVDHEIFAPDDVSASASLCETDRYFCNLTSGMFSLLSVALGAVWDDIAGPLMEHQLWLMVPFLACLVLSAYGVVNIIIAVVLDAVVETKARLRLEEKASLLMLAAQRWKSSVRLEDSYEDRALAIRNVVQHIIDRRWVAFPPAVRVETVIEYMKRHDDLELSYEDFIVSLGRLMLCDNDTLIVHILTQVAKNHAVLLGVRDDIGKLSKRVEQLDDKRKDQLDRIEGKLDRLLGAKD